ncbi:MAG: hypothetical protein QF482_06025 [Candidatus Poseidoniia archaeon]|nr:hypothetical protein [Candidatus Poseidoniia archaeon]
MKNNDFGYCLVGYNIVFNVGNIWEIVSFFRGLIGAAGFITWLVFMIIAAIAFFSLAFEVCCVSVVIGFIILVATAAIVDP